MPMKIKGKDYWTVDERIALARQDQGFSMSSSELVECNGRFFCRVTIIVKEQAFIGTSEVKFGAHPQSADGMSPIECAETSALGRALGFAGYGR